MKPLFTPVAYRLLGTLLLLGAWLWFTPMPSALAQTPASKTPTQALQSHFLYRTQAGDTVQKMAYQFLTEPSQPDTVRALLAANQWSRGPQSKKGFVFAVGTPVHIPTVLMIQKPAQAQLQQISGDAQLIQADQTATPAIANTFIQEGSRLLVGAHGRVLVAFPDESRIELQAGSSATFTQLRRLANTDIFMIDVQLVQGRLEAAVNPKRDLAGRFNIQSRRTVTGVRGTVFRVGDAADGPAVVEVLRGEVGFSAAGATVTVPLGNGSYLEPKGTPAQPVPLLAAPQWASSPAPAEQTPASPRALVGSLPLTLPAGAVSLVLELTADQPAATTRRIVLRADRALQLPTDLAFGNYRIVARALDANGLEGLPFESDFVLRKLPLAPEAIHLSGASNTLEWASEAQAWLYTVEIFNAQDTAKALYLIKTPLQSFDLSKLAAGHYRARIATIALEIPTTDQNRYQERIGTPSAWFNFERK